MFKEITLGFNILDIAKLKKTESVFKFSKILKRMVDLNIYEALNIQRKLFFKYCLFVHLYISGYLFHKHDTLLLNDVHHCLIYITRIPYIAFITVPVMSRTPRDLKNCLTGQKVRRMKIIKKTRIHAHMFVILGIIIYYNDFKIHYSFRSPTCLIIVNFGSWCVI